MFQSAPAIKHGDTELRLEELARQRLFQSAPAIKHGGYCTWPMASKAGWCFNPPPPSSTGIRFARRGQVDGIAVSIRPRHQARGYSSKYRSHNCSKSVSIRPRHQARGIRSTPDRRRIVKRFQSAPAIKHGGYK
ncbi:MAG: hypothetical protein U0798_11590 [Gemmataceae bacterium]